MVDSKNKSKKLKLLIATDNFLPRIDGISIFLSNILPALSKQYDITVISPNFGKYESEYFKHVKIPLGNVTWGDYRGAKLATRKIKKLVKKMDLIFSQTIGPIGFLSVRYGKKYKIPVASFMHSLEWELAPMSTKKIVLRRILFPFMKIFTKYIYSKANLIIMPSDGIAEIVGWRKISAKKAVANLGVDSKKFIPLKEMSQADVKRVEGIKKTLGLEGKFVIGTHGRLAREKDLFTIVRAFNWIKKKREDVVLLILGDGLAEINCKLKKYSGVIVPGAVKDVQFYINTMDVYITASLTETTSLATLEAMSCALPVVATPVGFIKEYIKDNVNGFLFSVKDAFGLYKKIDLLMNNKVLAKSIGERARRTVIKDFQWSNTVETITELLKSLEK